MDYYDDPYQFNDAHYFDVQFPSVSDVWETCMYPTIAQIANYFATFIVWNVVFRVASQSIDIPARFQHSASIVCGLGLLYFTMGIESFYSLGYTTITYFLFVTMTTLKITKYLGLSLICFSLTSLTIGEMLDTDVSIWHKMRGTQMVAAMKIISVGFDIGRNRIHKTPDFFEFWGYVLCPGSVVIGPWASYNDYLHIYHRPKWSFKWVLQVLLNLVMAVLFLLGSNCLVTAFIPDFNLKWGAAYKAALSYRCSHYFICFMSQCTMLMAGFSPPKTNRKVKSIFGYQLTNPLVIEFPRSLVPVPIHWNLSMHYWLKTYVFQPSRPHGVFGSILLTYVVSSLLHGVNIQLASVLLTLGIATYGEFTLRAKIADIFSACVLAQRCDRDDCGHTHKRNNLYVLGFNAIFSLLALVNLAYLGVMFEGPIEHQELGYSWSHVVSRWKNLDFLSHWFIAVLYVINVFL